MTQLFAILFFAGVLGAAVAILWSVVDEHRDLVLANLPWRERPPAQARRPPGRNPDRRQLYWAMPSISSDTPRRAMTVSPATVR